MGKVARMVPVSKESAVSLLDEIRSRAEQYDRRKIGPPCSVCSLPPDYRELVEALHSEGKKHTSIEQGLSETPYPLKANTIGRHYLRCVGRVR